MTQKALLQSAGDGTAVPAGYVGEKIKSSWVTGSVTAYTYTVLGSTGITLNPGTYNINVYFRISPNTTTTLTTYAVFPSTSNANNDNGVIFDADNMNVSSDYKAGMTNPNTDAIRGMTPTYQIVVPSGSTQTIYPKILVIFGASTCTAGLQIVAHRIA